MKFQLIVAAIAVAVSSCNVSREGCGYFSKTSTNKNAELTVAASAPAMQPEQTSNLQPVQQLPVLEAKALAISGHVDAMGEIQAEDVPLFAMAALENPEDQYQDRVAMTVIMANNLRTVAATVESRFAKRVLNKNADRMEKMNFDSNSERVSLFDKVKWKIADKFFPAAPRMAVEDILAITSLASGVFAFAWYIGFPFGVAAIVLGAIALSRGTSRRGMAIAGIVLGAFAIVFWAGYPVWH